MNRKLHLQAQKLNDSYHQNGTMLGEIQGVFHREDLNPKGWDYNYYTVVGEKGGYIKEGGRERERTGVQNVEIKGLRE